MWEFSHCILKILELKLRNYALLFDEGYFKAKQNINIHYYLFYNYFKALLSDYIHFFNFLQPTYKLICNNPHLPLPFRFQFNPVTQSCQTLCIPWTTACHASLSITNSWSPPKPMSIESVMPSNHLILCHHLLLLPSIFPSIGVFSKESVLCIRWPKYWNFSFNISQSFQWTPRTDFL